MNLAPVADVETRPGYSPAFKDDLASIGHYSEGSRELCEDPSNYFTYGNTIKMYPLTIAKRKWRRSLAVSLSVVAPGAGQMYRGNVFRGVLWTCFVLLGYLLSSGLGVILHAACVASAASGDPTQ